MKAERTIALDAIDYDDMTKEIYKKIYKERMDYLVNKYKDNPDYDGTEATLEFEETATVDEIVGFYIFNEGDNALEQWLENTDGLDLSDKDKEVTKILTELYVRR